jgi:hypothetical protein
MGKRVLLVSTDLIAEMLKGQGVPRHYTVIDGALPDDARVVDVSYEVPRGPSEVALLLESVDWLDEPLGQVPLLVPPKLRADFQPGEVRA